MRLIDADALSELVGEPIEVFLSRIDLKLPPTVDAIPISWLEELHKTAQSEEADMMIDEIISLWEARENEIS